MAGASPAPEDVLVAETAGRSREGVPLPAGVAADGRRQGDRADGVPVIDLAAEEEKEGVGAPRAKEVQVIDLTAAGEEEKEGQGVDGPRAVGVPPVIDLTGESSDEEVAQQEVKWVGHYSSAQSILLVGDGDFSFSLALATGFGSGANLVATSLDCYDTLKKLHTDLKMRRFDRVVFNFPHAGFKGKENQPHMIKSLVKDFFRSASLLLRPDGEVHVSHKTKYPYRKWNLEELALGFTLVLVEQVDFHIQDYPGYSNKRGDGLQCDQPFLLGECSTFKFRIGDIKMKRVGKLGPMSFLGNRRNARWNDQPIGSDPFNPTLILLIQLYSFQKSLSLMFHFTCLSCQCRQSSSSMKLFIEGTIQRKQVLSASRSAILQVLFLGIIVLGTLGLGAALGEAAQLH